MKIKLSREGRKTIKAERAARNWSLERAAVEIGITKQALNYIERGMTKPHPLTMRRIAETYGLDLEKLAGHPVPSS